MKICCSCKKELPLDRFSRNTRQCKDCARISNAAYRAANKDRIAAQKKTWYWINVEKQRANARRWAAENPERAQESKLRWYEENAERLRLEANERNKRKRAADPEAARAYEREYSRQRRQDPEYREFSSEINRQWRVNNPEKHAAKETRRRAKKLGAPGNGYTGDDVNNIRKMQNDRCAICNCDLFGSGHVDHIIPLARGGANDRRNLQLLCPTCNISKGARDPIYHMRSLGFLL